MDRLIRNGQLKAVTPTARSVRITVASIRALAEGGEQQ